MVGKRTARTAASGRTTLRDLLHRMMGGRSRDHAPPEEGGPRVVGYVAPGSRRIQGPDALRAREEPAARQQAADVAPPER